MNWVYKAEPDPTMIEGFYTVTGPGMANAYGKGRSIRLYPDENPVPDGVWKQGATLCMLLDLAFEAGKKARSEELMKLLKG